LRSFCGYFSAVISSNLSKIALEKQLGWLSLAHVQGEKNKAIRIANTDTKRAGKAFVANAGAKALSDTND